MVFSTGQILGIVAFTAVVLAIGGLLLKLDGLISSSRFAEEDSSDPGVNPVAAAANTRPGHPGRRRCRRR